MEINGVKGRMFLGVKELKGVIASLFGEIKANSVEREKLHLAFNSFYLLNI